MASATPPDLIKNLRFITQKPRALCFVLCTSLFGVLFVARPDRNTKLKVQSSKYGTKLSPLLSLKFWLSHYPGYRICDVGTRARELLARLSLAPGRLAIQHPARRMIVIRRCFRRHCRNYQRWPFIELPQQCLFRFGSDVSGDDYI